MITLTKTTDNLFRITYINENGIQLGVAAAEYTAAEIRTIVKLNEMYFDEIYSSVSYFDSCAIGEAMKAVLKRGVNYAGNEEFENLEGSERNEAVAKAIYAYLTTNKCEEFKDKLIEHGYEIKKQEVA